ncbi:hypothetical protein TWF506_003629 [Arthrobotrys conoides]|uniref:Uncharacterized protein n=1 Tax=Arthrobotrys conoides TaxID=74498 RepID=A0AAN8RQI8_9PEZI
MDRDFDIFGNCCIHFLVWDYLATYSLLSTKEIALPIQSLSVGNQLQLHLEPSKPDLILPLAVLNLEFPEDLFDNLTPITFDHSTQPSSERSIMDEFPSPPTQHSLFDEERLRAERKRQKKQAKLQKSSKPERYHHTPAFAAQSFALTATPEIFYKTDQSHKLSRPVLDQTKARRNRAPKVVQPFDDRSSGEYDRNHVMSGGTENGRHTPTWGTWGRETPKSPPNRFMTASPQYELFSSTILNQNTSGTTGRAAIVPESFTRGRPDWSEMDEKATNKGLQRSGSLYSTKSQRPGTQSTKFTTVLKGNTVLRVPRAGDAESIYQGRGCVPWRIRAM